VPLVVSFPTIPMLKMEDHLPGVGGSLMVGFLSQKTFYEGEQGLRRVPKEKEKKGILFKQ
jgi:hypothetical protein